MNNDKEGRANEIAGFVIQDMGADMALVLAATHGRKGETSNVEVGVVAGGPAEQAAIFEILLNMIATLTDSTLTLNHGELTKTFPSDRLDGLDVYERVPKQSVH